MNIILFGFKSCGKSTIGKHVAEQLQRPFIDTDQGVERLHFRRTGQKMNYRNIYKTLGEDAFRALESDVVEQLKDQKRAIIAVGGGLILDPKNQAALAKLGQLVYLKLDKETLKKRILERALPAYFDPADPEGSFEKMYTERSKKYEEILALPFDMETKTQDQVATEVCALIQRLESENGK